MMRGKKEKIGMMRGKTMIEEPVRTLSYNGGEAFTVTTKFFQNGGPGGIFMNHEITLNSYANSASFNLCGVNLTPEKLRELANLIEENLELSKKETCCPKCGCRKK